MCRRRGKFICPCACTFDNPKVWERLLRASELVKHRPKRQRRLRRHGAILSFHAWWSCAQRGMQLSENARFHCLSTFLYPQLIHKRCITMHKMSLFCVDLCGKAVDFWEKLKYFPEVLWITLRSPEMVPGVWQIWQKKMYFRLKIRYKKHPVSMYNRYKW